MKKALGTLIILLLLLSNGVSCKSDSKKHITSQTISDPQSRYEYGSVTSSEITTSKTISSSLSDAETLDKLYQTGVIEKNAKESKTVLLKGLHIVVYKEEVDKIAAKNEITGVENPRESAVNYILRRETLLYEAQKKGYKVTNDEVKEQLENEKKVFEEASNYEDILEFLRGAGLSIDEYFDSQFDNRRKDLIISQLTSKLKENFVAANNLKDFEEINLRWNEELQKIIQALIEAEKLREIK